MHLNKANKMSYTKKDLEKAFTEGRLYEAGELELDTAGRETAFEVWLEVTFPNDKANKISNIKRILEKCFEGSTTTAELEADSSPCISSAGTNKMNVSTLVERFYHSCVAVVTYNNETEIADNDLQYEELEEDVIDDILYLLEQAEVDHDKTMERCQD